MWGYDRIVPFDTLLGKTLVSAEKVADDCIEFVTTEGEKFSMYHDQDCCESVTIEDICGELDWLVGSPILLAEEATSGDTPDDLKEKFESDNSFYYDYSQTWTFYHLRTMKGVVTLRWFGTSNGYYSESVDLHRMDN